MKKQVEIFRVTQIVNIPEHSLEGADVRYEVHIPDSLPEDELHDCMRFIERYGEIAKTKLHYQAQAERAEVDLRSLCDGMLESRYPFPQEPSEIPY